MIARILEVRFVSYWSVSSGAGGRASVDREVVRDPSGLPYVPGRTVKGLLVREALERGRRAGLVDVDPQTIDRWLGTALDATARAEPESAEDRPDDDATVALEKARYATRPATVRVSSAVLPEAWRRWAAGTKPTERDPVIRELFRVLSSTALTGIGVAAAHTLRSVEVAVPMTLTARITGPDDGWDRALSTCLPLVRELGNDRNRGLGRCELSLREVSA